MEIARSMGGPIPGQSLTREPGASPWEKPPQYTDLDEAMEFLVNSITKTKNAHSLLALMEGGVPITAILQTILMQGFMDGKWTPDLAILLMQPLTALLIKMAQMYEIEFVTGAEDEDEVEEAFVRLADRRAGDDVGAVKGPTEQEEETTEDAEPPIPSGGMMSPQGV